MGASASASESAARSRLFAGTNSRHPQVMTVQPSQHGHQGTAAPGTLQTAVPSPYPKQQHIQKINTEKTAYHPVNPQPPSTDPEAHANMSNRPGYFQTSNPLPPIGIRNDVLDGSSGRPMPGYRPGSGRRPQSARQGYWSPEKDLIFMRILSADEFLGRMYETDEQITSWTSSDSDDQLKYTRIKELLGLRGHLQDELLRIEAMLAEDDPDLSRLRDFEAEFPYVVSRLRELNNKSRRIQIQSTDIGIGPADIVYSSVAANEMSPISQGHSVGNQTQGQGRSAGTQSSEGHSVAVGTDEEVDDNLRRRFVAEEEHVAGDFAQRFARTGQRLGQADIDRLLNEHAISMQALRKKQGMEKDKYKELLEAKKRERLLPKRPDEEPRATTNSSGASSSKAKQGDVFFIDFSNTSGKGVGGTKAVPHKKDARGPNSGWFYVDMDGNSSSGSSVTNEARNGTVEPIQRQGTFTKENTTERTFTSESGKPVGLATRIPSISPEADSTSTPSKGSLGNAICSDSDSDDANLENIIKRVVCQGTRTVDDYDDDFEDEGSEEDEEKEDLKSTLKDDLWTTLREEKDTSKTTFQELMNAYRDQEDGRQAIKDAEKMKHKASFLSRLADKNAKKGSTDNEIQTQTDGVTTSSMSTATDDPFEKELEAIKDKDRELVEKLMTKRKNMSDEDFQKLLKKHLSDIEKLRKQRARDQERLHDKLKQRLKERRDKKGSNADSSEDEGEASEVMAEAASTDSKLQRELTKLEEKLQNELRKRGKNIDESDLTELLEHYRRQQEALLKQRRGERNKINDKLKMKLESKKVKRTGQDSDEEIKQNGKDDSLFQELQRMQLHGELTEDMFSKMMQEYLDKADQDKQQIRRKRQPNTKQEVDRNAASTLVQEHQEQTKQIKGIRQRQKDILDQKLQKKLMAKKNKGHRVDDA